jgi:hypothetical protein
MARVIGLGWSNYSRAENIGTSLRADCLYRALVYADEAGVSFSEVLGWLKADYDAMTKGKE